MNDANAESAVLAGFLPANVARIRIAGVSPDDPSMVRSQLAQSVEARHKRHEARDPEARVQSELYTAATQR